VGTVAEISEETATARTVMIDVPGWPGHAAGQHVDVRLTAEDGYSAQRSYSIASAPGRDRLELTVQRLEDGEVSPYLTDVLMPGYPLELRGPIGGWFVWDPDTGGSVLLVAPAPRSAAAPRSGWSTRSAAPRPCCTRLNWPSAARLGMGSR
jgi:ferredoxin-NADP reductase